MNSDSPRFATPNPGVTESIILEVRLQSRLDSLFGAAKAALRYNDPHFVTQEVIQNKALTG